MHPNLSFPIVLISLNFLCHLIGNGQEKKNQCFYISHNGNQIHTRPISGWFILSKMNNVKVMEPDIIICIPIVSNGNDEVKQTETSFWTTFCRIHVSYTNCKKLRVVVLATPPICEREAKSSNFGPLGGVRKQCSLQE